jgi:hypothetical protein
MIVRIRPEIRKVALILALFLCPAWLYAQPSLTYVALAQAVDNTPSVTASIYSESGTLPVLTDFEPTENKEQLDVLSSYYFALNQGNTKSLRDLYFEGDGSRDWFVEDAKKYPQKYNGNVEYKKVEALKAYQWGDYSIYYVARTKSDSKVRQWVDVTVCVDASCFISNLLFEPDSATDIASAVMYKANMGKVLNKNPSYDLNFDVFPRFGSRYPITIFINMDNVGDEGLFPGKSEDDRYTYLSDYFNSLSEIKQLHNGGELSVDEITSKLIELNQRVWSSYDEQKAHRQYTVSDGSFSAKYFSEFAYLEFLTSFDRVSVAGTISSEDDTYLLLRATMGHTVQPLIFLINNSGRLKQTGENTALRQVFMSDEAIETFADWVN